MRRAATIRTATTTAIAVAMAMLPLNAHAEVADADRADAIEEHLSDSIDGAGIPGAAVAGVTSEGTPFSAGVGEVRGGADVTPDTPFLIGSISKTVTALVVLQLEQAGELELDEPIDTYLPWFEYEGAGSERITVRNLLEQRSGIGGPAGFDVTDRDYAADTGIRDATERLSGVELISEPGSDYHYTSANFLVLGAVVEAVTDDAFADVVQERVFEPLDMGNSTATRSSADDSGFEPGYQSWFGRSVARGDTYDNSGAPYGYMTSTANDLAKFLAFMQGDGGELLDADRFELLRTPPAEGRSYGIGWFYDRDGEFFYHGGATPEFRAELYYSPDGGSAGVILTNRYNAFEDAQVSDIMAGVRAIADGDEADPVGATLPVVQIALVVAIVLALAAALRSVTLVARGRVAKRRALRWGTSVAALLLAAVLVPALSFSQGTPFRSIWLFAPDVALLVVVLAVALGIAGITSIAALAGVRRPGRAKLRGGDHDGQGGRLTSAA